MRYTNSEEEKIYNLQLQYGTKPVPGDVINALGKELNRSPRTLYYKLKDVRRELLLKKENAQPYSGSTNTENDSNIRELHIQFRKMRIENNTIIIEF